MRALLAVVFAVACGSEPTLIGKLCSDERPCPDDLLCDPNGVCVAELEQTETLSLITDGPGFGIVTSAPAGLRCEESCEVDFSSGLSVTLSAHPLAGSGFAGWKGACSGVGDCTVSMSDALTVTAVFGVAVDHPWMVRFGGAGDDRIGSVDVDLAGDPLVAGHFASTVRFDGTDVVSRGGADGFIAKLEPTAQLSWISTYGGANDDIPRSVAVSLDSKVLAAGWYVGPADLFGESHAGAGNADPLLARLDADGGRELALDLGSSATDTSESATFDDAGGAWVAGWTTGPLMAGGITRGHVGGSDAYLIHYDDGGAADVVEVFGGTGDDKALSVDRSPTGDRIAVFGVFQGSIAFGAAPITSSAAYGLFVALFDGAGEPIWSKGFGSGDAGSTAEPFGSAVFDRQGNLLIAGGFYGTIDFGDSVRRSAGDVDAFVAKLSPEGAPLWVRTFGGASADAFFDLAVDPLGNAILGGGFNGTVSFGADPLVSAGSWDALLVKLDDAGEHVWSRRFGGNQLDVILGVGVDVAGTALAGGHFAGTIDFGSTLLTSVGSQDAFLLAVGR